MRGLSSRIVRFSSVALLLGASMGVAFAQSGVKVEVKEMSDNRVEAGPFGGSLELKLTPTGNGLDRVVAARAIVKKAHDDKGTDILGKADPPDFQTRDYDSGTLTVQLRNPARNAKSIAFSGNLELFVPAKDPNSTVKIARALSKLDAPLSAKALKAEKLNIRLLSPEKYAAEREKNKIDDAKIAEVRERAKAEGVSEKEVEAMIELAKALQELGGGEMTPGAIILSGKEKDLDRIIKIRVLKSDGTEVSIPSRSSTTSGDDTIMVLDPAEPPPADATLELTLLTKKSTMSFPFDVQDAPLP